MPLQVSPSLIYILYFVQNEGLSVGSTRSVAVASEALVHATQGEGVSMLVAARAVAQLGGVLGRESECSGNGSTFFIELPLVRITGILA
jgi:sensor histidine kinase regulating citrate/malate metabolism